MQRHEFNCSTTREEHLIDLVRKVRADMEALSPCTKCDDLIQQLRELEMRVELNPFR
jgi:hypothetical protein